MITLVPPEPADAASPCTGVCVIGEDELCEGCWRTLDEIAGWSSASVAQKRAMLARVAERRPLHSPSPRA